MEEENKQETEIRFGDLLDIFLHCWWIMLIVGAIIFVALFAISNNNYKPEYTATATVYVMKEADSNTTGDFSIANTLVNDFMELTTMDRVITQVCHETGLIITPKAFRQMVSVESIESTRFVYVSVTAADPQKASDIANSLAATTCDILNNDLLNGQPFASVANASTPPTSPSNPISLLKFMLFALVGAIIVYGVYFVIFLLDDKMNDAEDVTKYLGLNVLGQIPNKHEASRRKKGYYAYSRDSSTQQ